MRRRSRLPVRTAAVAALSMALCTVGPAYAAPAHGASHPYGERYTSPSISWRSCPSEGNTAVIECGTMAAPLDHAQPGGPSITVHMRRVRATQPERRQGTIFVNPGGPGGSGYATVTTFVRRLGPEVTRTWDVIGIDPRGVGLTEPFVCDVPAPTPPQPLFPYTPAHVPSALTRAATIRQACTQPHHDIAAYMSTADTAHDLDLARQAVGDAHLTYYGVSYGTYLGAVYEQLFPQQVRALALESVLDPTAWSGSTHPGPASELLPVTARLGSGHSGLRALNHAVQQCAQVPPSQCRQAGTITAMVPAILARLRQAPISLMGVDEPVTFDSFIAAASSSLYDARRIRTLFDSVEELFVAMGGVPQHAPRSASVTGSWQRLLTPRPDAVPAAPPSLEPRLTAPYDGSFLGVMCTDSLNPDRQDAWAQQQVQSDRDTPGFGPFWLWKSAPCAGWPAAVHPYRGPFTGGSPRGALLINATDDPATPLEGAQAYQRLSPASRLVTIEGFGHAALPSSTCAQQVLTRYLTSGALPHVNLTCTQDKSVFPPDVGHPTMPAGVTRSSPGTVTPHRCALIGAHIPEVGPHRLACGA